MNDLAKPAKHPIIDHETYVSATPDTSAQNLLDSDTNSTPKTTAHVVVTPSATFNGVFTPLVRFAFRRAHLVTVKTLGQYATSVESFALWALFQLDNFNPIAWWKLTSWFFHPGRYAKRPRSWGLSLFIRVMFLLTNFAGLFVQYSAFLFTPKDKLQSSFVTTLMNDPTFDGMKYSGFTNHILQTLLLYHPEGDFGRNLVSASRFYMEDVQVMACLCAPAIVLNVEGNLWIKLGTVVYTVLLWLDFLLKRNRPQNIVRRKIGMLAEEVHNNTYPTAPGPGEIRSSSAADVGFPHPEKRASIAYYYALFFILNAILRAKVYAPVIAMVLSKIWTD